MKNINSFFSPKSIAIVGASPKKGKLGNVLIENIRMGGWKGRLYFINPKYAGSKPGYYSNLAEIGKPIDLALLAIPAQFVNQTIENGAKAKPAIKNFVVISSGFKESGSEGKGLEENLRKIAERNHVNVLGPNCLGFVNTKSKLNATFTDVKLQPGNAAVISQSGALAVALLDWAQDKTIGFSKIISIGNKTVLDESDLIDFLSRDRETKSIALYLEDIKNGFEFMKKLTATSPRKPIVILKAGKTAAGQKAVSSHTGSLAQNEEIIEAVFEKLNIISAENIEEFQDIIYYLNSNPVPSKSDVVILTNAGGPGVMASDFIGRSKDIGLLNLKKDFKERLKKNMPTSASVENPIDVIGDASPKRYQAALDRIAADYPQYPTLVILTPQNQTDPEKVAQILIKMKKYIPNLSACFMGGEKIKAAKAVLQKNNIVNFENPERALSVIEKLCKYRQKKNLPIRISEQSAGEKNSPTIEKAYREKRKMLFWKEAEKIFGKYGVRLAKSISFETITELNDAKLIFPCALKTDDPNITHRMEKNAVILNIRDRKELQKSLEKMKKETGAKHFLFQKMAAPGLELIVGMTCDPTFGPVVLCGWGGSFTEIFKDKTILIPPFNQGEIERKLSKLAVYPILKGFRGKRGYDLGKISRIVDSVAHIAHDYAQIKEIDINPLVVYNNGKAGQILDAKIFLT